MTALKRGRPPGQVFPAGKKPARTASSIVKDLFAIIDRANVSAVTVGANCGMHQVSLSRWKHGISAPNIREFENVAQTLGYRLVLEPIEAVSDVSKVSSNS
jgi:hypothetical protein